MQFRRNAIWLAVWAALTGLFGYLQYQGYALYKMPDGQPISQALMIVAAILTGYHLAVVAIKWNVKRRHGAAGEVTMLGGLLRVVAAIGIGAALLYLFGQLRAVGTALGAFSGLLLGWSLQAPVSGLAAWVMISLKRPFRIGDRIQLPSLGLVGDVVNSRLCHPLHLFVEDQ